MTRACARERRDVARIGRSFSFVDRERVSKRHVDETEGKEDDGKGKRKMITVDGGGGVSRMTYRDERALLIRTREGARDEDRGLTKACALG